MRLIDLCAFLVAILLPLAFNPYSRQPVEATKALLLQAASLGMAVAWLAARLGRAGWGIARAHGPPGTGQSLPQPLPRRAYRIPLAAYLGANLLAALLSIDPAQSWWGGGAYQGVLTLLALALLFWLVAENLRGFARLDRLVSMILVGSVPVAIYGCLQYFGLDPLNWQTTSMSRVQSTVGYSLYLGAYLSMAVPFTLARLFAGPDRLRWCDAPLGCVAPAAQNDFASRENAQPRPASYAFILVLQVACMIFTLSRGALLALLSGCLIFLGLSAWRWQRRILLAGMSAFVVLAGLLFLAFSFGWGSHLQAQAGGLDPQQVAENRRASNADRLALWRMTIPLIARRPWLGYGPETYALAFSRYYPDETLENPQNLQYWDPHNLLLSQLMSAGLLGLAALIGILVAFYRGLFTLLRRRPARRETLLVAALLSAATAYLVQAQFNPGGIVPTALFWLVLAAGVGIACSVRFD